jgi:hypothetical protein
LKHRLKLKLNLTKLRKVKMITINSNIEFLSIYNAWRRDISDTHPMPMQNPTEIGLNLDFAIQSLRELELLKHDIDAYVRAASDE